MRHTCLNVLWLVPIYSWKSSLQIATEINFCDETRCLGAARAGVPFRLWPGCAGRSPPYLQWARFPWSNRSHEELGNSGRGVLLYVTRGQRDRFYERGSRSAELHPRSVCHS
jgi:hypothetical protein